MAIDLRHSIRLYFPYTFDSNASLQAYKSFEDNITNLQIGSLIQSNDFINPGLINNVAESKLWQKENYVLDKAIHRFVHKLINGADNHSEGFFGMNPIKLSADAINLLNNGSNDDAGSGIKIALNPGAINRLSQKNIHPPIHNNSYPLMFNDIWFFGLNMGIGMAVVEISIQQPNQDTRSIQYIEEIQEIIYKICKNSNDDKSANLIWGDHENGHSLGLSELVHSIIPVSIGKSIKLYATTDPGNTFAYTYIATDQHLTFEEKRTSMFCIARKYNELYLPENLEQQANFFEPFKSISHTNSLEGVVSLIDFNAYETKVPKSLLNLDRTAIANAYAPIVLLTYAEYIFLREMESNTTDEDRVDMRNPTNKNLSKLRLFRSKLYDFRLNFRFAQISGNTNHNIFCNASKESLESEILLLEISSDMQEIEQYILDHVSQKRDNRLKKYGMIVSFFAVIIGWVDLWGLNLHSIIFEDEPINQASVIIFLLVLSMLTLMIFFLNRKSSDD